MSRIRLVSRSTGSSGPSIDNGLRIVAQPGFEASSENISGSSPRVPAGSRHSPLPGWFLHEEVDLPGEERMLDERVDAETGVDERRDDLAESVIPAVLDLVRRPLRPGSAYEPWTGKTSGSSCCQYG